MASPQKENGNTGISNELLERLLLFDFPSASPLKIWLFVARKTYGYQKKTDYLSLSQIQQNTDLTRPTVVFWLDWLVKGLLLVKGSSSQKGTVYGVNKDYEAWVVKPLSLVKRSAPGSKRGFTHNKKIHNKKNTTVPIGTPAIKLGNEIYTMDELQYINEEEMHEDEYLEEGENTRARLKNKKNMLKMGRRDNKYGPKVMAVMARHFAKCAGVEITDVFDASPWMRPLSAIYRYFGKDADKAMLFMTRAIGFFEEKNLSYNPQTLHDNLPLIDKWIEKTKAPTTEIDQDVSSRRRL